MASIVKPLAGSSGTIFPSQALPAGPGKGISDYVPVDNYQDITFFVEYTRSGAGGGFLLIVEASNDKINWYSVGGTQQAAIVAGTDVTINMQKAVISFQATGVSAERITTPTFTVMGHWMRITIGELSAFPGVAKVDYFLKGGA